MERVERDTITTHYRVFVSHSQRDSWVAEQIRKEIHGLGAVAFCDTADIKTGDDWQTRIYEEIRLCTELVALFTPWSGRRAWVWTEFGAAWGMEKRVIGVLHGIDLGELEKIGEGRSVLHEKNVIVLNEFDKYLIELSSRIKEGAHG